jgi:GIY-YIG catalytic domain.
MRHIFLSTLNSEYHLNISLSCLRTFFVTSFCSKISQTRAQCICCEGICTHISGCEVYIGQTKRNLETRTKEHFRNLRLNHTDKSAMASHFWNTRHEINNTANLLKSVNRKNELITWEKTFIHKHAHHIMNFEVLPVSSLIRKYICRPPDSASMASTSIATMRDTTLKSI